MGASRLFHKARAKVSDALYVRSDLPAPDDVPLEIFFITDRGERTLALEKVRKALRGIKKYAPVRYAALIRNASRIRLVSNCGFEGRYIPETRTIELNLEVLILPRYGINAVAACLIHESEHARLHRLGFSYSPELRWRIERICFRAERNFGRRIAATKVVARAEAWLNSNEEAYYQPRFRRQASLDNFAEMLLNMRRKGYPYWTLAPFVWLIKYLTPAASEPPTSSG